MANKPWKTLKTPGYSLPLEKYSWETLKFQPTPEKLCSEADFPSINSWLCSAATLFIPVAQWKRTYEVIGGKAAYHLSCGKQPLPNNGNKVSSKTQNEGWMGTGRRPICGYYIFRKHNQKYPGKPLKFGRKSPEKPW